MGKHTFIRHEIKKIFIDAGLEVGKIIQESYHSQLRNAFAHGQYSFDDSTGHINLCNYRGESWELERISYAEWEERFLKSAILSYEILDKKSNLLIKYGAEKHEIDVYIPDDTDNSKFKIVRLWWNDKFNCYFWPQNN